MAEADFTVDTLAAYLHIGKPQVLKLVERGKLPGRRVGGDWRFSNAEIHHWLEERIGLSSDEELQEMEGTLGKADGDVETVSIASLLPIEAISVPLAARTRASVIGEMVSTASQTGWLWDPDKMIDAVRTREELMPTAMDNGVALLHPRRPLPNILDRAFLALGRCDRGIPFGNARGIMTDIFFLICSTDDRTHLRTLARLSRLLTDSKFIDELRGVPSAYDAHQLIVDFEESLT